MALEKNYTATKKTNFHVCLSIFSRL